MGKLVIDKPIALDLFCGAGGAAKGLQRAGFHVVGIDNKPQPHYCGDSFIQWDAMDFPLSRCIFVGGPESAPQMCLECGKDYSHRDHHEYDFIWASPPCQAYSQCTPKAHRGKHPDLIAAVRQRLERNGVPFVIENVPSAAVLLQRPLMLCGSHFGLKIRRHRFFELSGFGQMLLLPRCDHREPPVLITGTHRRTYEPRYEYSAEECREASGLTWMTRKEMDQAIPPAYSEFIGKQAIASLARCFKNQEAPNA